jgi:hypothetical protein
VKLISKQAFYKVIYDGEMDICVAASWNNIKQLMSTKFTFRNGKLFGMSYHNYDTETDNYGEETYEIVDEYYPTQETTNEN